MSSNHYLILGVTRDATTEEIRAAYLRLARSSHPDLNHGDAEAALKFKNIQLAYETLTDSTAREQYDKGHVNSTVVYATGNRSRTGPVATADPTHSASTGPRHPHTGGSYTYSPRKRSMSDWLSVIVPTLAFFAICVVVAMHVSNERSIKKANRLSRRTDPRQEEFESYKERREKLWTQLAQEVDEELEKQELANQSKASSSETQSKIDWQKPAATDAGGAAENENAEADTQPAASFASNPMPLENLFEINPDEETFKSELLPEYEIDHSQLEALDDFYAQLESKSFELKKDTDDVANYDAFENLPPPSSFDPPPFNSMNSATNYTPGPAPTTQLAPLVAAGSFEPFKTPGFTPSAHRPSLPAPTSVSPATGAAAGTWNPATGSGQFNPDFTASNAWQPGTSPSPAPTAQMRTPIAPSLIPPINHDIHNPYKPAAPARPTVGIPGLGRNY